MKLRSRQLSLCLVIALTAALPLAGCGGDDDDSGDTTNADQTATQPYGGEPADDSAGSGGETGGASQTLALAADPDGAIAYDKTELTANAGKATLDFENASSVPHAVEVEGNGIEEETETITGGKATLALDLKPGTYEFYCPVGDHEAQGMKGVLTVK